MSIRSKIIAITGGSQGLGKAMARALCSEGARVAIIGRDAKKLLQVSRDITGDISTFPCDIGDPKAVQETFNAINTELGGLDVLINNAAIYPPFKLENGSDDQIRSVIETNILGTLYTCREAIPLLKKSRGDIINISSEAVSLFPPLLSVYAASKAAVETLSKSLRLELAQQGIRVATLRVGHMKRIDQSALDPEIMAEMLKAFEESGFAAQTGEGMEESTVVNTLMQMLKLPADANIDFLEVRSRR